jgi:hypothetical protein
MLAVGIISVAYYHPRNAPQRAAPGADELLNDAPPF